MADPPPYEESTSTSLYSSTAEKYPNDGKSPTRMSIREELGAGRSQRVATLASQLLPQVRARARQGFSKSVFLLMPPSQLERKGTLVGYPENELPIIVELEGDSSAAEFWTQEAALALLTSQLQNAIADNIPSELPVTSTATAATAPKPPAVKRSSFWGKKTAQPVPVEVNVTPTRPSVVVVVQPDEASFRAETDYGLFETLRTRCISIVIDIR